MRRFLAVMAPGILGLTITGTLAAQAKPDTGVRIFRSGPNRTLYRVDTLVVTRRDTGQCNWEELRVPSHPPTTYGQFLPRDEQACTVVYFLLNRTEPIPYDTAKVTPAVRYGYRVETTFEKDSAQAKPDTLTVFLPNYGGKAAPMSKGMALFYEQGKDQKYRCMRKSTKNGTDATYVQARSESDALAKAKEDLPSKALGDAYVCVVSK